MNRPLLFAALIAAGVATLPTPPAFAQRGEKVLTIFGNDPCPTSNGEEIVVCQRLDENERYRIPKELRGLDDPANATWADRARSFEYVGAAGPASCTPVGGGGGVGCYNQIVRKAREENRANGQEPLVPLKLP